MKITQKMTYKFAHKVTTVALIFSVMTFVVPVAVNANFVSVPPKDDTTVEESPVVYVGGKPPKDDTTVEEAPTTSVKPPKDDTTVEEAPVVVTKPPKDDTTVEEAPTTTVKPPKDDTTVEEAPTTTVKPPKDDTTVEEPPVVVAKPPKDDTTVEEPPVVIVKPPKDDTTVEEEPPVVIVMKRPINAYCSPSKSTIKVGESVTYSASVSGGQTPYKYSWNYSSPGTSSLYTTSFSTTGTKNVTLTVLDDDGDTRNVNCSSVTVVSNPVTPPVDHDVNVTCSVSKSEVYVNEITAFTANVSGGDGTITYKWSGAVSGSNSTQNAKFTSAGTKVAYITVTDADGDTSTATCNTVNVNNVIDIPVDTDVSASCTVSKTSVEKGEVVTFTAHTVGGDGNLSYDWNGAVAGTGRTQDAQFTSAGTKNVSVVVTDADGDKDTALCTTVVVREPIVVINDIDVSVSCTVSKSIVEKNEVVTFTAHTVGGDGNLSYDWNGAIDGTGRTQNAKFTSSGTKTASVVVTDIDGDKDTAVCETITVKEPIITHTDTDVNVTCRVSDTTVGKQEVVTFTADISGGDGTITYDWNGAIDGTNQSESVYFNKAGTKVVSVRVTDADGDTDTSLCDTVTVEDEIINHNDTDVSVTCQVSDTNIEENDQVTYTANTVGGDGTLTYVWNGSVSGTHKTETVRYTSAGTKSSSVTVIDEDGDRDTATCSTVHVEEEPNNDNFDVTCRVSDTSIDEGDTVTYSVDIYGGNGSYDYDWDGDISGDGRTERVRFSKDGTKRVEVTVTDNDGNRRTDSCPNVRVDNEDDNDDLRVSCRVSDTSVKTGDKVTYTAEVRGGNSPYDYDWDGDISGNDRRESVEFDDEGRMVVRVTVEDDDGNEDSDTCPTVRVDDEKIIYTTGGGSSVSSVFLSQVPYTGPGDVLKGIGFTLLLLVWSVLSVHLYRQKRSKKVQSEKIEAFRIANKKAAVLA